MVYFRQSLCLWATFVYTLKWRLIIQIQIFCSFDTLVAAWLIYITCRNWILDKYRIMCRLCYVLSEWKHVNIVQNKLIILNNVPTYISHIFMLSVETSHKSLNLVWESGSIIFGIYIFALKLNSCNSSIHLLN